MPSPAWGRCRARRAGRERAVVVKPIAEAVRVALKAAIASSREARACTERLAGKSIAFASLDQRLVVCFEAGTVRVESDGSVEANATVRGSPLAVCGALLGGDGQTAAVFGDPAVFEDFRASFRPHLELPHLPRHLGEDLGDAAHLAARAARSALQGLLAALGDHPPAAAEDAADRESEMARMCARIGELEARLAAMERGSQSTDRAV